MYVTINIHNNRQLVNFDTELIFVKEPTQEDMESIAVYVQGETKLIPVGYVANSVNTVIMGTYSAGRAYDKLKHRSKGRIIFKKGNDFIIAKVDPNSQHEFATTDEQNSREVDELINSKELV